MANPLRWDRTRLAVLASVCGCLFAAAQPDAQPSAEPRIAIHTPARELFDLALDEIELDWSHVPETQRTRRDLIPVRDGRVRARSATRALFAVRRAAGAADLTAAARELETANAGARAHLVVYEAGKPRSIATRRILTSSVAVLLDDTSDARNTLRAYASHNQRQVGTLPGAYVFAAGDPLAAVDLAEQLRTQPGVRAAYPLLERQQFTR